MQLIREVARSVPFDNDTNGFSAEDTQAAIEEAKATAAGLPRFTLPLIYNGTVSNGDWITYSNLTPNARIILPVKCRLQEVSWSNSRSSADFDYDLYKNGRGTGTLLDTLEIRNLQYGYFTSINQDFNAGDIIDIEYIDQGTNASDLCTILYFQMLE